MVRIQERLTEPAPQTESPLKIFQDHLTLSRDIIESDMWVGLGGKSLQAMAAAEQVSRQFSVDRGVVLSLLYTVPLVQAAHQLLASSKSTQHIYLEPKVSWSLESSSAKAEPGPWSSPCDMQEVMTMVASDLEDEFPRKRQKKSPSIEVNQTVPPVPGAITDILSPNATLVPIWTVNMLKCVDARIATCAQQVAMACHGGAVCSVADNRLVLSEVLKDRVEGGVAYGPGCMACGTSSGFLHLFGGNNLAGHLHSVWSLFLILIFIELAYGLCIILFRL